jgi:CBS-domain-containing membrane protein
MGHTVEKVMTRTVAVVNKRAPFKTIVEVIEEHRVSAVPVVDDDGTLVGIVTEEDLLLKEGRFQDDIPLLESPRRRRERHKAEALLASDLMTAPVVTVGPQATLTEAARRMHERHVKRLPVVDATGRLLGIVSQADLLRVFVRPDPFLERDVREGVIARHFPDQADALTATVHEGVLHLTGTIERASQLDLLLGLLEGVDGLVGIENEVSARIDDLKPPPFAWATVGAFGYAIVPSQVPTGESGEDRNTEVGAR